MPATQYAAVFTCLDRVVEIVSDDRDLLDLVPTVLPLWERGDASAAAVRFRITREGEVWFGDQLVARTDGRRDLVLHVLEAAVSFHLALCASAHVFIHAGVVALGDRAIVIPGRTMSGKSTLVSELVRAGATYYSDEYAAVDADGMIHAHRRPLRMRPDRSGKLVPPPPMPAPRMGVEPVRAGLLVLTSYQPGASWRPVPLTTGQGALALLGHTIPARTRPGEALAVAARLARDASVIEGPRGEAHELAPELLKVMRSRLEARGKASAVVSV